MYKKIVSIVGIVLWAVTALGQKGINVARAEKTTVLAYLNLEYPKSFSYEFVFNFVGSSSIFINKLVVENKIYTINKWYFCDNSKQISNDTCAQYIEIKTFLDGPYAKKNYLDLKNSKYQNFYKTKMGNAEALIIGTQNNKKFYLKILKINKHEIDISKHPVDPLENEYYKKINSTNLYIDTFKK